MSEEDITLENVHGKSVYELRQEVDRRKLKLPAKINQNSLMQCLITDLMREKDENEKELFQQYQREQENLKQKLLEEKKRRKEASRKRSVERQRGREAKEELEITEQEEIAILPESE